jgi:hypothetical protein
MKMVMKLSDFATSLSPMDDGFVLPLKWSWRSQAKRCIQCGWLFSCTAWHEDRKRCLACTSNLGELRLKPEREE